MDVQRRDSLEELDVKALGQIFEPFSLLWVCPSLPHHAKLDHHIGGSKNVLGQGDESLKQGSGLGLGSGGHTRDGAFADEAAHGEGVDTEAKHPGLGSLVVG